MAAHRNSLTKFISYSTLLVAFVIFAHPTNAQTAPKPAEPTKPAATTAATEPVAGSDSAPAATMNTEIEQVAAKADAASTESGPASTKVAEPKEPPSSKVAPAPAPAPTPCRNISADVVALYQPIMLNRLGAAIPNGMIFALRSDLDSSGKRLREGKRPRPLVLRANVGDCLTIKFENLVQPPSPQPPPANLPNATPPPATVVTPPLSFPGTTQLSIHVQGMEWVNGSQDDGSYVGLNNSSLAGGPTTPPALNPPPANPPNSRTYTLYAKKEGTYLLYTMGDTSSTGDQLLRGLFGALNVQPATAEWYRSQVSADDMSLATYNAGRLPANATLTECDSNNQCVLTTTVAGNPPKRVKAIRTPGGNLNTPDNHPLINYKAVYPNGPRTGTPILRMLDDSNNIVYSDLTAMITGPEAGRFKGTTASPNEPEPACNAEGIPTLNPPPGVIVDPLFCANPAAPDRKQPYREITIIYHGSLNQIASQAFPVFTDPNMTNTVTAGADAFAINYGTGGIGAEIYANRIGVGPMGDCVDCKYEEFFLSAWSVGDPAMLVDKPANSNYANMQTQRDLMPPCNTTAAFEGTYNAQGKQLTKPNPQCANNRQPVPTAAGQPYDLAPLPKATRAFFSDDPSNVYHSYINDHVKFRILHGGTDVSHVHHQHAHQWLQTPNSDQGSYLDSQMISPGASYTLEMVYNGSGNRNKVVGDSIFHCHFYPHFAAGMWAMWRTHDVFESGTYVFTSGPNKGQVVPGARALPDGEIKAGTPTPGIIPLPTLPMAPLPAYAQIQNNVQVNGAAITVGGQVVIGGTCQGNKINGLDVIGGNCNGQQLNGTVINSQFDSATQQMTGQFQRSAGNKLENPGYPYFIPGIAGARAPHPPMDFAVDPNNGGVQDGGLQRHVVVGGTISNEQHTKFDWSKDLSKMNAVGLPEDGTPVEKAAITFFSRRCYATFFPDGTPGSCPSSASTNPPMTLLNPPTGFILNGLPNGPQPGAPFADPAVDDNGNAVGTLRRYKAAAIQLDVTINKKGWHFPQQRILTLWQDVQSTYDYKFGGTTGRQPEPLFFRGNSGDIIEYWHTNLVPNYYLVDDFQVRTPTDILGQHIHLVKFDVTSSDGAANGFNYEDGTYSPQEVQEMIAAINAPPFNGLLVNGSRQMLQLKSPPKEIVNCTTDPGNVRCQPCPHNQTTAQCQSWLGAQTTIQRWYLDPLLDNSGVDRTLRTVFTHDHFGPSTHQQAGLYAGLLVEPTGSVWKNSEDGTVMPNPPKRTDGGPTSWKADILTKDKDGADISYREFALEFQDFQLAYDTASISCANCKPIPAANPNPSLGWRDPDFAITPPTTPQLISTALVRTPGTSSINYLNEPLPFRVKQFGDLSLAYDNTLQMTINPNEKPDPATPLMRAYQNDNVQVRILVGAHVFAHQFNLEGPTWFAEPSWKNSGYRSVQAMGLSEHFELLFKVPSSAATTSSRKCPDGTSTGNCVDYLYSPSLDESGLANGMWGLFRAYNPAAVPDGSNTPATKNLQFLTNNTPAMNTNLSYSTCPANLPSSAIKRFNVFALSAQRALADISPMVDEAGAVVSPKKGWIVFNNFGNLLTPKKPEQTLHTSLGIMYVRAEDLISTDSSNPNFGKLKAGAPVEPLILRANAGDCIEVTLTNALPVTSDVFKQSFKWAPPFDGNTQIQSKPSFNVGLHPQLLSYDAALSNGMNVGWNSQGQAGQVVPPGHTITYQWYAGKIDRDATGTLLYTPVEFGALNLFPSDPMFQHRNGLFGSMVIEPAGSKWRCDQTGTSGGVDCDQSGTPPTTRASATVTLADNTTKFREFVMMVTDNMLISSSLLNGPFNTSAVNYRTEPQSFRYNSFNTQDFSCMLSNQLNQRGQKQVAPQTPIFTAAVGDAVRFRMTHPFGTGTSQVFSLHGHAWQRNPYTSESRTIGDQPLSQSLGSRDNHGSSDHFDLVVDKAGGEHGQAGDYLYTVFVPNQATLGAWGLFRVGDISALPTTDPACTQVQPATAPTTKRVGELLRFIRQPPDNINSDPATRQKKPIAPNPKVKVEPK